MRWFIAAVTVIFAAVAAVAFSNLYTALQRSRQKRTMADMRSIGTMLEARASDTKSFAFGAASIELRHVSWTALERALVPKYARKLPRLDGWQRPMGVYVNDKHYLVRSAGSDGRFEGSRYSTRISGDMAMDLVFADGNFIQYADGL